MFMRLDWGTWKKDSSCHRPNCQDSSIKNFNLILVVTLGEKPGDLWKGSWISVVNFEAVHVIVYYKESKVSASCWHLSSGDQQSPEDNPLRAKNMCRLQKYMSMNPVVAATFHCVHCSFHFIDHKWWKRWQYINWHGEKYENCGG